MEKIIQVKSSSDEIYSVVFKFENDLLSINCNCKAGIVKMLCKHRLSLLEGDITDLNNISDKEELVKILNYIDKDKIKSLYNELNKVELDLKRLTNLRKNLRKDIGIKFSNGF
jgi:ABC-type antimicrobial peptide transport system ATPase subunit